MKRIHKNAFSILMSSQKESREKQVPRDNFEKQFTNSKVVEFSECPICSKNLNVQSMWDHLENNCKGQSVNYKDEVNSKSSSDLKSTRIIQRPKERKRPNKVQLKSADGCTEVDGTDVEGTKHPDPSVTFLFPSTKQSVPGKNKGDAFSLLMEAARLRPRKEKFLLWQESNGCFIWEWDVIEDGAGLSIPEKENAHASSWSCEVPIKEAFVGSKTGTLLVATNISSSIEFEEFKKTYRHRTSRFSVPVLKSFLQKNVRQGRAEAAVRVAFELIIKSWTDFIRRFPIIILEDSFLHPAIPLLVWLMVADGRGYAPSRAHVAACLHIVHEVAMCQWKDTFNSLEYVQAPVSKDVDFLGCQASMICRAILCRMRYGGMACDCNMLQFFVWKWKERFSLLNPTLPANEKLSSAEIKCCFVYAHAKMRENCNENMWLKFTAGLYEGIPTAEALIDGYLLNSVLKSPLIRNEDAILSGIDFHVSSVIEDVLSDRKVFEQVVDLLQQNRLLCSKKQKDDLKTNDKNVINLSKDIMWHCCSSLNARSLLLTVTSSMSGDALEGASKIEIEHISYPVIWQFIELFVNRFQQAFVDLHL